MAPTAAFNNDAVTGGVSGVTHVALLDTGDSEIGRKSTGWSVSGNDANLSADLDFSVPGGTTVGSWRGYDAASGGTSYGGAALTQESFTNNGTYTLLASDTGYRVQ